MSYGIVNYFKDGTKAQYDATVEKVHPDNGKGLPPGQTHRVGGETDDGFIVCATFESKAAWEKFRDGTLLPALGELGDKGLPGPPQTWEFEVYNEAHK
jgi:hypothetical protein